MSPPGNSRLSKSKIILLTFVAALVCAAAAIYLLYPRRAASIEPLVHASTLAGISGDFGEPFGVAIHNGILLMSDGEQDRIWKVADGKTEIFAEHLETPSGIAFNKNGDLIVADSGSHTIKSIDSTGVSTVLAGAAGEHGGSDGNAAAARFNAPLGVAAADDGRIIVADTYNDSIRVIENGMVRTLAGGKRGFADGNAADAKFDTPCGVAVWQDKVLVADSGNGRIRVVEPDGRVWTLTGGGDEDVADGTLASAKLYRPTSISVANGNIYFIDGNAIRVIVGSPLPVVRTISGEKGGLRDGAAGIARFNRPSGIAADGDRVVIADSDNRLLREISASGQGHEITREEIAALREKPEEFRAAAPARWPYDPPSAPRDIAGTLGELRGEIRENSPDMRFHNGLDIAGAYGETARFIRDEKVLRPFAIENVGGLRELIRMPSLGYIHIRIGRDQTGKFLSENSPLQRFFDNSGKLTDLRMPRGTRFKAGDPIGTLNPLNHVHLIAGRSGREMNALDALLLPGVSDSRSPQIEGVRIVNETWQPLETSSAEKRIKVSGRFRVLARSYDQMDGNNERRRLGLYRLGYKLLKPDGTVVIDAGWSIKFDRNPDADAVQLVYAPGSKSGATGETIFEYIVTNKVDGDDIREAFVEYEALPSGVYTVRVLASDYFGNTASKDVEIEVIK